ncbi:MAG: GNAT family N-acetyltransferase [Solirubrobacteraceae bacterium]
MSAPVQITRGAPHDVERLEALWVSVHRRHADSMPELAPYVGDATIGEIESLAVLPEHRGRGIGTELLDRLERELLDQGVSDLVIGVLPGNAGALRMYERRGYRTTWMYLSRFGAQG